MRRAKLLDRRAIRLRSSSHFFLRIRVIKSEIEESLSWLNSTTIQQ